MTELETLLLATVTEPLAEDRWLILGDWLEEHDDPRRAELLRLHRRLLATCCEPNHPARAEWQTRIVALLEQGVQPCVPRQTVMLSDKIEMAFHFIPPGTFLMGSPEDESGRWASEVLHQVTLTQGYWLGSTAVTQEQWQAVMKSNPSKFAGRTRPVERVTWHACKEFCRNLGERLGRTIRLPWEAEWERACRCGTTTPWFFGNTITTDQANFDGHYGGKKNGRRRSRPTSVQKFPPNGWGLFEMHANVWNWCEDWYGAYPREAVVDPTGPSEGENRVIRGGCWRLGPIFCRSANHAWYEPDRVESVDGFRVCLGPEGTSAFPG